MTKVTMLRISARPAKSERPRYEYLSRSWPLIGSPISALRFVRLNQKFMQE
jgi:hypothetical protein